MLSRAARPARFHAGNVCSKGTALPMSFKSAPRRRRRQRRAASGDDAPVRPDAAGHCPDALPASPLVGRPLPESSGRPGDSDRRLLSIWDPPGRADAPRRARIGQLHRPYWIAVCGGRGRSHPRQHTRLYRIRAQVCGAHSAANSRTGGAPVFLALARALALASMAKEGFTGTEQIEVSLPVNRHVQVPGRERSRAVIHRRERSIPIDLLAPRITILSPCKAAGNI
jgi:hypothetical protein